jgi:hypothetical protein
LTEREAEIVVNTILDSSTRKEMTLYAYVIMPNHMHILIKPMICGISKAMQLVKLPALKGGVSRKGISFYIVPLDPALKGGACGALAGQGKVIKASERR